MDGIIHIPASTNIDGMNGNPISSTKPMTLYKFSETYYATSTQKSVTIHSNLSFNTLFLYCPDGYSNEQAAFTVNATNSDNRIIKSKTVLVYHMNGEGWLIASATIDIYNTKIILRYEGSRDDYNGGSKPYGSITPIFYYAILYPK